MYIAVCNIIVVTSYIMLIRKKEEECDEPYIPGREGKNLFLLFLSVCCKDWVLYYAAAEKRNTSSYIGFLSIQSFYL